MLCLDQEGILTWVAVWLLQNLCVYVWSLKEICVTTFRKPVTQCHGLAGVGLLHVGVPCAVIFKHAIWVVCVNCAQQFKAHAEMTYLSLNLTSTSRVYIYATVFIPCLPQVIQIGQREELRSALPPL